MWTAIVSNPIIQQMDRIVQSVNNKTQNEVQHIRQARKDTVVLSAKALFIAEESKKAIQAEQKEPVAKPGTPLTFEDIKEMERQRKESRGYRSEYHGMYVRDIELEVSRSFALESKKYLELADNKDISDEQRQKYLNAADVIKKRCVEDVMSSCRAILKAAENDNYRAEKIKRKSNFEGITMESLGFKDLGSKSIDEIIQAIDDARPKVVEIAEKINKSNQLEYNENLSQYRPWSTPWLQDDVGEWLKRGILAEVLSTKYNYEDAKVNPEKPVQFNPDEVEHIEGIVNKDPEYAIKNGSFSSGLYPNYQLPR